MLIDICESDPRFPTELGFRMFVSRDEALSGPLGERSDAECRCSYGARLAAAQSGGQAGPVAGMTAARWRGTGR